VISEQKIQKNQISNINIRYSEIKSNLRAFAIFAILAANQIQKNCLFSFPFQLSTFNFQLSAFPLTPPLRPSSFF